MTAPLFHLEPGALDHIGVADVITLAGSEGHHAATVMRLQPGEPVLLSDTVGLRAQGRVRSAGDGQLEVEILSLLQEPRLLPRLVLVQALAKDRRDLQGVESATELGVDAVIPWQAERSVARWKAGREAKKHAEWVAMVRTAAKQTRRTTIPEVRPLHSTSGYLQAIKAAGAEVGVVVLHETDETSLAQAIAALQAGTGQESSGHQLQELHLVVGPEGGISDREIELLTGAGAQIARLGPTVLRSSTAGPAALAAAQLLLGRWDWDTGTGHPEQTA
ncbi:16S rRNA (uracil(1498)-N(3))-methyltransferase [Nesterenkonia sp. E16_7]|uniref:16S rRNA (uracil(1498)-N(3))-methyltransferase n=1 Tax=unclassified Nesterenkonia TaxID=2629769 RepID=UPI001A93370D|nr:MULTISPECIES: 16S rRNA (uracil(1498)-N(3))-methyltransferase [unclassified Nesterenkonia]MBO0595156.1 16S rRNA (uracil(1498)-N(3))-methyltransferase [Nesterenkonia sp. E16_10]MBO0599698.1 16S rRNA (uracil(1498)-N(3))-methyltransferase [Nesterenkonia sp. E16_7]